MKSEELLSNLNFNYLRVFDVVYRRQSMTEAARELHLTQSGISQHIKALEDQVGQKLFDRIHRRILPTDKAHELQRGIGPAINEICKTLETIAEAKNTVSGVVRMGMPIEYGNNVLTPLLAKIGEKYPRIKYEIHLDYATKFNEMILENKLDFAFVDSFQLDRQIKQEPLAEEALLLCSSEKYIRERQPVKWSKTYFEELDYIAYQSGEPILRQWLSHHLKRKNLKINVRSWVMDVQMVAKFIRAGFGVGVLPDHLVERLQKQHADLVVIERPGMRGTKNSISLAYLKRREFSRASEVIIEELKNEIKKR